MTHFVSYASNGRILWFGLCPSHMLNIQGALVIAAKAIDDRRQYVKDGVVIDRPINPVTVLINQSAVTLQNLPVPSEVTLEDDIYKVEDGELEIVFSYPGTYRIYIKSFPYLDKEIVIENNS